MAYEQKPGKCTVWPNEDKQEDWHDDYKGQIQTESGEQFWIGLSGPHASRKGKTYWKINLRPQKPRQQREMDYRDAAQPVRPAPATTSRSRVTDSGMPVPLDDELDDSIPF